MESRRQFLAVVATSLGLGPVVYWLSSPAVAQRGGGTAINRTFPVEKSDGEWRSALTEEQYYVLRGHGTEQPGSHAFNKEKRRGTYSCVGCANPLFDSDTKYESGTGWPSFYRPLEHAVATTLDRSFFMVRTEVHCRRCGGHLGHLFDDGPRPTGLRYCMNGSAMTFAPRT